jgi:hypothetical protein
LSLFIFLAAHDTQISAAVQQDEFSNQTNPPRDGAFHPFARAPGVQQQRSARFDPVFFSASCGGVDAVGGIQMVCFARPHFHSCQFLNFV